MDYKAEVRGRVDFIRGVLKDAGADGIVYNNSGGKDATLTGILCKMACENTVGLILPCGVNRNYENDRAHALALGAKYNIEQREIDLLPARDALVQGLTAAGFEGSNISIAPRLRMTAAYAVANSENRLVAGTGNRSEGHMGYFTKWGDGAYDFNPIADLTVTEIFGFLRYLGVDTSIIEKSPSAGLYEGQTDEGEMGITYRAIDDFLLEGKASDSDAAIISKFHNASHHKRAMPITYGGGK